MQRRQLEVNLHDTHIGLWQGDANDPTLKTEIFDGVVSHLRQRGFTVAADPRVLKQFRCLSPRHRIASRGDLRAEIQINGCVVQFEWWSEASPPDNPNGRRYDFDRRKRMPYLDGLRFELEVRHLLAWLAGRAVVTLRKPTGQNIRCGRGRGELSAADYIQARYNASWHIDPATGRPKSQERDRRSAERDGSLIEHGARVWFRDRKGRINAGIAHSDGGTRWIIAIGTHQIAWADSFEIFTRCPPNLRVKRNDRERRKRLEGELAKAIRRMDFLRAETLRKVLFGAELTYGIWAADKEAFYCSNYSGYTADSISAGRYTWDEAATEVRRVPHELRLVLPNGKRLKAAEVDTARAA